MPKKLFKKKRFTKPNASQKKSPGPGPCSLHHQQQGWAGKVHLSTILELTRLLQHELGEERCKLFERIYIVYR